MDNNIKDKIMRLRRTIGHFSTIISCKKTIIFTNHQKKLKVKYKKYRNTKLHTPYLNIIYMLHP